MKRLFPLSFYNSITLIGAAIAAVSFGLVLFLMLLETMSGTPKPYMGIIAFVILFSKYSGTEVKIDAEEHLIMREDDLLAVLD